MSLFLHTGKRVSQVPSQQQVPMQKKSHAAKIVYAGLLLESEVLMRAAAARILHLSTILPHLR